MAGGVGSEDPPPPSQQPPLNSGEFLLRLLQKPQNFPYAPAPPPQSHPPHNFSLDPAVAAIGPTIPLHINEGHRQDRSSTHPAWPHSRSPTNNSLSPGPPNFFHQVMSQNQPWPHHPQQQQQQQPAAPPPPLLNAAPHLQFNHYQRQQQDQSKLMLYNMSASLPPEVPSNDSQSRCGSKGEREFMLRPCDRPVNQSDDRLVMDPRGSSGFRRNDRVYGSGEIRNRGPPPGFSGDPVSGRRKGIPGHTMAAESNSSNDFSVSDRNFGLSSRDNYGRQRRFEDGEKSGAKGLGGQIEHPGLPSGMTARSARASEIEESLLNAHALAPYNGDHQGVRMTGDRGRSGDSRQGNEHSDEFADLSQQLEDILAVEDGHAEMNGKKQRHRDKDFRSDPRGQHILSQRMRNLKRMMQCRSDIEMMNPHFLQIFETLIPTAEEKAKQKQLMTLLDKLVSQEWPKAKLYLYGSCANSFGVSKSDIDVCLVIDGEDIDKSEVLLKLADILKSSNLVNVQALTRARVPIVKLADPDTGISCDICLNNVLAVVNTKLLRDYAEIDRRLRQLAFIVKHWAKSRGVNETYQGTLSSYAYVLMCIHFLQQRRPAILPCLQGMRPTYAVKVDDIECSFFDQVEKLQYFGDRNTENIAELVWGFFNYWAYCHDYANSVISVRTGGTISKQAKDWTRRVGNDRHLICIEDPFETSHDLGRVVDKHSIRVLREEFERAAEIMQFDPNPCVELFKPYVS